VLGDEAGWGGPLQIVSGVEDHVCVQKFFQWSALLAPSNKKDVYHFLRYNGTLKEWGGEFTIKL